MALEDSQNTPDVVLNAKRSGLVVPAFNVPYLPMVEPVIQAVVDQDSFALVETARLEWIKFSSSGLAAVMEEFAKWHNPEHVRLHLDHVPVIDEDEQEVEYLEIIGEALELGYQSVMLDGSRLSLADNIAATRQVAELSHNTGVPCEAELGAVLGHEAGPLPPYEELFKSGLGFTDVAEAKRFVRETNCDWLSVAIGNIHGAVSGVQRDEKKVSSRLNISHLNALREATGIPLVLHGGSGVQRESVLAAIESGIAKVNVGTELRQAYETALRASNKTIKAQDAVYESTCRLIAEYFGLSGTRKFIYHG